MAGAVGDVGRDGGGGSVGLAFAEASAASEAVSVGLVDCQCSGMSWVCVDGEAASGGTNGNDVDWSNWVDVIGLEPAHAVEVVARVDVVVVEEVETGVLGPAEAVAVVSPPRVAAPVTAVEPPAATAPSASSAGANGSNGSVGLGFFFSECLTAIVLTSSGLSA